MKFTEIPYARPDMEEIKGTLEKLTKRLALSAVAAEALDIYREYDAFIKKITSMMTVAFIRSSIDTTDIFYDEERKATNEMEPLIQDLTIAFNNTLASLPFRQELERRGLLPVLFRNIELEAKTSSKEVLPLLQEENLLVLQYSKLIAAAQIDFEGKRLTLSQLRPYMIQPDREKRREATLAQAKWGLSNIAELDEIFDKLVKLRTEIAHKLGFESFIDLAYCRERRNCYNRAMVESFRDQVVRHIVPLTIALREKQAKRLGVERLMIYDQDVFYKEGTPAPKGTPDELLQAAQKMYDELSAETGAFFAFLQEKEMLNVLSRKGKEAGGYCTEVDFEELSAPFIFANFNGTAGDVDVLTHEAGHAFAFYQARDTYPYALREGSSETCEVHSMSMELFTRPWMDMEAFFGEDADRFRTFQLTETLYFLPYGTMVDEFQHRIYGEPDLSPAERNQVWKELEGKYRPWLHLGIPFYEEGRRWQLQTHIYQNPFYYIDYCLAQSVALSIWALDQKDHETAWKKYRSYIDGAGKDTFVDLLDKAGLANPFEKGMLEGVAKTAMDALKST